MVLLSNIRMVIKNTGSMANDIVKMVLLLNTRMVVKNTGLTIFNRIHLVN
jgi:hypothetical protein